MDAKLVCAALFHISRFILNLSISNLVSLFLLTPLSLLDQTAPAFLVEPLFCSLLTLVTTMMSSVTLLSSLLIGLDQYVAVTDPLSYHRRLNKKKVVALCASVWVLSLVASLLVVLDPYTGSTYFTWSLICQPLPTLHPYSV